MSVINANPLLAAAGGDYQISRSVRLRSSASAYFNRTNVGSPTNAIKFTWSGWVKRGTLGTASKLIAQTNSGSDDSYLQFRSDDAIGFGSYSGAGTDYGIITSAVFRDPSAWYHVVAVLDTANATSADRAILYVNGVRQTVTNSSNGMWPQNATNNKINTASQVVNIGRRSTPDSYLDGYLTEINFIDGQALTPSSFGETDSITGVWKPKKYAGTYGTNGFYLNFSDNSAATAAAIGKDSSGNGNNWTPNNISVTAGVTYDSMLDTPTPYADGGNGRGNYATVNPLCLIGTASTVSNGNLTQIESGANNSTYLCTMAIPPNSGKWYFEMTATAISGSTFYPVTGLFPVGKEAASVVGFAGYAIDGIAYYASGSYYANASSTALTGSAVGASGNTRCFAYDSDTGKLWTRVNGGAWENSGDPVAGTNPRVTLSTAFSYYPYSSNNSSTNNANFGQRPFAYTPPTGFKALNTQNLPDATIKKGNQYFDVSTWTGTGATQSIVNNGAMQPDFLWIKSRNNSGSNHLYDALRGTSLALFSDATSADNSRPNSLTSFNSNGFTLGSSSDGNTNLSTYTYVGWQWKESASAGFDIVTYTGTGSARTVSHNLGVAPKMMIIKSRSLGTEDWAVYHESIGNTYTLYLDRTLAKDGPNAAWWNNTSPTSSVFTVGTANFNNQNAATYVAYLFAEVAGYSKFGSYTGNGSTDGPFVYCGFRPRWVLVKRSDSTGDWNLHDTSRDSYNVADKSLFPNASNAETTPYYMDILSNGFKIRDSGSSMNTSSGTYIFMALAENPFKNSLAR